jgi:hypothetical protein
MAAARWRSYCPLQQAADHEALAIRNSTVVEARRTVNAGTATPLLTNRMGRVDLAHFGLDLHVDKATAEHSRRERQADTIFL